MESRREATIRLLIEVRDATDEMLALFGPRAVVAGGGEPTPHGSVIDEAKHEKLEAARERLRRALDEWMGHIAEGPG